MRATMPTWRRDQPVEARDDTTRFLCAAAHLDQDFADDAIREFLVEPTRSTAPSPGVDAGIVLGEAVAARTRRKLRDVTLIVFALLFVVACVCAGALTVLAIWFVAGLLLALFSLEAVGKIAKFRRRMAGVPLAIIATLVLVALIYALLNPYGAATALAGEPGYGGPEPPVSGWSVVAILCLVGMLGVLLADELLVRYLVTTWFRPNAVPGNLHGYPPPGDRWLHSISPGRFIGLLSNYRSDRTEPAGQTPVIVYRGYTPFVGAGKEIRSWAWAIPLERRTDQQETLAEGRLTTELLYASVREELSTLRRATPLSPSRRLAGLHIFDQVILPADELIDRYQARDNASTEYLPSPMRPPVGSIDARSAQALAANAQEWARYYLCFRVETWDRDLVLSVFVHFAMDEETLYVEWTSCVLWPIKERYQQIDGWSPSPVVPALHALSRWVALPATILGRALRAFSIIRPVHFDGHTVNPARYGAGQSLREMAADDRAHNYFQLLDLDRYLKIMDARFVRTVGRVLDEHGYSSELFRRQAEIVTNHTVNVFSGNFAGPVLTGDVDNRGGAIGGGLNGGGPESQPHGERPGKVGHRD